MKLGIVGHGFVGTAVDHGFTRDIQKFIVDPKHNSTNTIEDLIAFKPDATFVAVAHRYGLWVHPWTVNDPAEMERLIELGVDGIFTDRADLLVTLKVTY